MEQKPSTELILFDDIPEYEQRNYLVAFRAILEPKIDPETNTYYNAFELFRMLGNRIAYTEYEGLGAMITGIGDIEELPPKHYFALFVNGEYSSIGISSIVPTEPIVIEFEVHQY